MTKTRRLNDNMKNIIFHTRIFPYLLAVKIISDLIVAGITGADHEWLWVVPYLILTSLVFALDNKFVVGKRNKKYSEDKLAELRKEFVKDVKLGIRVSSVTIAIGLIGALISLLLISMGKPLGMIRYFTAIPLLLGVFGLVSSWIAVGVNDIKIRVKVEIGDEN